MGRSCILFLAPITIGLVFLVKSPKDRSIPPDDYYGYGQCLECLAWLNGDDVLAGRAVGREYGGKQCKPPHHFLPKKYEDPLFNDYFCPFCDVEEFAHTTRETEHTVKGKSYTVKSTCRRCWNCGFELVDAVDEDIRRQQLRKMIIKTEIRP